MLKLIEGGFSSVAREDMKREMLRLTEKGVRTLLIVPEQKTVTAEAEMSEFLPPHSPLVFEVTNFTRLANSVFRSIGGIAGEYCDAAKEALIMWRTLTELSPFLSVLGAKEINTGLVEKALSAMRELKRHAAEPSELQKAAESDTLLGNRRLASKLTDIARIMALYKSIMNERYTDVGEDIDSLIGALTERPDFFSGVHFFIEGFTSFTEPQYTLLGKLMRTAELTVLLPISKIGRESYEFTEILDTERRLKAAADKVGADKRLTYSDTPHGGVNHIPSRAASLLWRGVGTLDEDEAELAKKSVRIFEASDVYGECAFISADIKERVMKGARYRDFAIVARDASAYEGIIDAELQNCKIPYFLSKHKQIFTFEEVKLIYTAFAVIESNFSRESVISYIKCGFCGVSREACDIFELYTEKWGISGRRFFDGVLWNMNPQGFDGANNEINLQRLRLLNETRDSVIAPLLKLSENMSCAKTVREKALALYSFLTDISLPEQITERKEELLRLGEAEFAAQRDGLWRLIAESLDILVEVLGDLKTDNPSFISQLKIVHSFINLGRIPSFFDEVTLGSADMIRLSDKKHIYIMGVNEGEFPRAPKGSSLFTDRDKILLSKLGITGDNEADIAYARELFSLSRAFAAAGEDVTVSYSMRNAAFEKKEPSEAVKRLSELCLNKVLPIKISELPKLKLLYSPEAALDMLPLMTGSMREIEAALAASGYSHELAVANGAIKNDALQLGADARAVAYSGDISLSQSKMEAFLSCPLKYFLRYTLKLDENERAEFNARNIGSFIHSILEGFFARIRKTGEKTELMTEGRLTELVKDASLEFLSRIDDADKANSAREKIMLDRLIGATVPIVRGLCEELRGSAFTPSFFELKMSDSSPELPSRVKVDTDGGSFATVGGSIDRVDTYKSSNGNVYVRVIDYKTGSKSFSPDDLDEGKNMQMFLYLRALTESEKPLFRDSIGALGDAKIIPAGVIYVNADITDVRIAHDSADAEELAIKAKQERRGMLLDDAESISAMNRDYIPVKYKKDGTVYAPHKKLLYSEQGWREIMQKLDKNIESIASKIKSGDASAHVEKGGDACKYCKFKAICRSATFKRG